MNPIIQYPPFTLIALFLLALCPQPVLSATRPNFVIIMSDDHHYDEYGWKNPRVLSPTLNRLKSEGTLFNNFYVASTVCQPSRYAMFSGRYPARGAADQWKYGVTYSAFNTRIYENDSSFAHRLTQSGYKTGYVGKIDGYTASDFKDQRFNGDPLNDQAVLVRRMKSHGYTYAGGLYKGNVLSGVYHNMEWLTKSALDFLESSKNDPFCLVVCPTLVHDNPLPSLNRTAPENYGDIEFKGRLTGADLAATQVAHSRDDMPGVDYTRRGLLNRGAAAGVDGERLAILWMDDGIGAIMRKCEKLGVLDNTYFIYLTDHGDGNGAKGDLYQNGINMPLLIRYPNGRPNTTSNAVISQVDIMATVYDLANVTPDPSTEYDGISFKPVLADPSAPHREAAYSDIGFARTVSSSDYKYMAFRLPEEVLAIATTQGVDPHSNVPHDPARGSTSVFSGHFGNNPPFQPWNTWFDKGWSYHADYFKKDQLYDIRTDADEKKNLAYIPAYSNKLLEMKALMADVLYDVPGSFSEFKFEVKISGTTVTSLLNVTGDLDLSYPFDLLAVTTDSNLTANSYTIIKYTGKLIGKFSQRKFFQSKGYEVDYSFPKEVRIVKSDYSMWKTINSLATTLPDDSDQDQDGIPLLMEYAMDLGPGEHSTNDYVLYQMGKTSGSSDEMQLIFKKLRPELNYTVQWSTSLAPNSWSSAGITEVRLRRDFVKATLPSDGKNQAYFRVLVSK